MGFLRKAIKTGIAVKVIEVAKRELAKPENQRKLKEGLAKVQKAARDRRR
jgi:hypothetical protein